MFVAIRESGRTGSHGDRVVASGIHVAHVLVDATVHITAEPLRDLLPVRVEGQAGDEHVALRAGRDDED
jgi:archaellin